MTSSRAFNLGASALPRPQAASYPASTTAYPCWLPSALPMEGMHVPDQIKLPRSQVLGLNTL